jgi:hypothetical protein
MPNPNHDAKNLVNLTRYPIVDLESTEGAAFARSCHEEYLQTGLCMLAEFIVPQALQTLAREATSYADDAYFCKSSHSAYLTADNPDLADDDVARRKERRQRQDRTDPRSAPTRGFFSPCIPRLKQPPPLRRWSPA